MARLNYFCELIAFFHPLLPLETHATLPLLYNIKHCPVQTISTKVGKLILIFFLFKARNFIKFREAYNGQNQ